MAELRPTDPSTLVIASFSRRPEARAWARGRLIDHFGPIALQSDPFPFHQTCYYEPTMGSGLRKEFLVFQRLTPPDALATMKRFTIDLETELAASAHFPETRPLNLDPGLLTLGKFLLATTKDQAHRIYLGRGIFAEVTLRFHEHTFEPWPWTYADYREPGVIEFLNRARDWHRRQVRPASHTLPS
jgi:hypothetical protein